MLSVQLLPCFIPQIRRSESTRYSSRTKWKTLNPLQDQLSSSCYGVSWAPIWGRQTWLLWTLLTWLISGQDIDTMFWPLTSTRSARRASEHFYWSVIIPNGCAQNGLPEGYRRLPATVGNALIVELFDGGSDGSFQLFSRLFSQKLSVFFPVSFVKTRCWLSLEYILLKASRP
ncbi:hypothetical protein DEU56DRAFT_774070 [Suillus clintonianus]|uniref:uncharacterized protein n=1 Tax=Suillus clintonianus TaxID=1904413 RepID=UPI001B87259F|nr:uncharacterized protein DEU56DRAFT_774070 [Suillus clintonianus]KAG2153274.1 hypothetical protein DEU56DRAFT_774070 [Suillus clintonianus]